MGPVHSPSQGFGYMFGNGYGQDRVIFPVRFFLWYEGEGEFECQVYVERWGLSMLTLTCQYQGPELGLGLSVQ